MDVDQAVLDKVKILYENCRAENEAAHAKMKADNLKTYMDEALFAGHGISIDHKRIKVRLHVPLFSSDKSSVNGKVNVFSLKAGFMQEILEQNWEVRDAGKHCSSILFSRIMPVLIETS